MGSVLVHVSNITIKNTTLCNPHKVSNVSLRDGNKTKQVLTFFNIKKMAADFCSAQCLMGNTGSLNTEVELDGPMWWQGEYSIY